MALTAKAIETFNVPDDLAKCQRDGILTYTREDQKMMIYGGTLEKIVDRLLGWLVTDPERKCMCNLCPYLFSRAYRIL